MSDLPLSASAPTARVTSHGGGSLVLTAGALTTVLALVGIYVLNQFELNPMGWYADYILPVGAVAVGLVASSGYAAASWGTGTKISGRLVVVVTLMLLGSYLLAQYLEFRVRFPGGAQLEDGTPLDFWGYYDLVTRSIAFEEHGKVGSGLGLLGYGVRALEAVGFVGGGVLAPWALRNKPYCESCGVYKRSPEVAWIAAGLKPVVFGKKKPERVAEAEAARQKGQEDLQALFAAGRSGDPSLLAQEIANRGPKAQRRKVVGLEERIVVGLVHCKRCGEGALQATLLTGQGKHIQRQALGIQPVERAVVLGLTGRR